MAVRYSKGVAMEINIEKMANGYLISVWVEGEERIRFFFETSAEVLAFLETNLD